MTTDPIHLIAFPGPKRALGGPRWVIECVDTGRTFPPSPHAFYAACRVLLNERWPPSTVVRAVFAERPWEVIETTVGDAAGLRMEETTKGLIVRKSIPHHEHRKRA